MYPVGGNFAAIEAGLLGTKQPDAVTLRDAERSTVENKRPKPRVPLLSGDFAVIEAALLGALREQTTTTVSEANITNAFPSVDLGLEPASSARPASFPPYRRRRRADQIAARALCRGGDPHRRNRDRRSRIFGLNSRLSGPPDIASIKADNGPDKPQMEATSGANVPAQDTAILSEPPEPSPLALDNGTKLIFDLPQAEEKSLPTEFRAELDTGLRPRR